MNAGHVRKKTDQGCLTNYTRACASTFIRYCFKCSMDNVSKVCPSSTTLSSRKRLEADGVSLSRATLSNWIIKTSEEWLTPVVEKLHEELLKEKYLHADETPVQVLNEEGKKTSQNLHVGLL